MKVRGVIGILLVGLAGWLSACGGKSEPEEEQTVQTSLMQETSQVTVMTLSETDFNPVLISNGKLAAQRRAELRFEVSGRLAHVSAHNGERVAAGQEIARLDSFRLHNATEKALEAFEKAKLDLKDVLIGQGYLLEDSARVPAEIWRLARTQSGYEQARAAYDLAAYEERNAVIRAPFAGTVANLFSRENNWVGTDEAFCLVIDPTAMEVDFSVLENELALIRVGDEVGISPFADPTRVAVGAVSEVNPLVDEDGLVRVKAVVRSSEGLFDGMNVRVRVRRSLDKQLVVPKGAVVMRSGKQVVFTLDGDKALWNYKPSKDDPTKEVAAYREAVKAGFTTISDVIAQSGGGLDAEDVFKARRKELDFINELGLSLTTNEEQSADQQVIEVPDKQNE